MANLTLRAQKGSPLTYDEIDGNVVSLNDELALANANITDITATLNTEVVKLTIDQLTGLSYIDGGTF